MRTFHSFFFRRDKKILIIGLLLFCICYQLLSSQQCIYDCASTAHLFKNEVSSEYGQVEYAVLIASAPSNHARRVSIRNSWTKLAANKITENEDNDNKGTGIQRPKKIIRIFFVIGTGGFDKLQLETENRNYHDMLLLDDFVDSYKALTSKMLLSLKWISNNMKGLKYLIKCDDDSFLRIDLIVHTLEAYAPAMDAPEISKYISSQVVLELALS